MDLKDTLLAIMLLLSVTMVFAHDREKERDDDDEEDPYDDDDNDDEDDGGRPNYCPEDDGMFPNPTDCAAYYNCVNRQAIAMTCAPGLLFDAENKICNFADRVRCKNQCRGPNGMFPSQHRCDEFILCNNNKPKVKRCKKGLYFDANLLVCNYKAQVLCSLPGGGSKGKRETGKDKGKENSKGDKGRKDDVKMRKALAMASVRSVCPKARGLFAHADLCHKFYQCYDGEVLVKSCPEGLLFDEEKNTCAPAKDVECEGRRQLSHLSFEEDN